MKRFYLIPMIIIFAFTGSYVYRSDPLDLQMLIGFGIFGYVAKKLEFDVAPMVMAFILGQILEYTLGQTLNMADGQMFFYLMTERWGAGLIYLLVPIVLAILVYRAKKRKQRAIERGGEQIPVYSE